MKLVNLFEICSPKQWKTISGNEILKKGKFPVYGANGIIGYYDDYNHDHETLLITCRGATCGTLNISVPKSYVNGNAMALDDLSDNVDLKFLYYSLLVRGFDDVISGSAQPQITREGLQKVSIPLFPLSTQKAIAEKLDKADALRKKDKELLAQYDELAQAIFIDMFGDPVKNERGWEKRELRLVCNFTQGIQIPVELQFMERVKDSKRFLRISDYTTHVEPRYVQVETSQYDVDPDDLVCVRYGASAGIIGKGYSGVLANNLFNLNYDKFIFTKEYLFHFFLTPYYKEFINKIAFGAAMPALSFSTIGSFKVLIPGMHLQTQFAEKIKNIEAQKAIVKKQAQQSEDLFQALLQESFNFN